MKPKRLLSAILTAAALGSTPAWAGPLDQLSESARVTFYSSLAVDAAQTAAIRSQPGVYETNPILGKKPNAATVGVYFAVCAVGGDLLVQKFVKPNWAKTLAYSTVNALELYLILKNNPDHGISEKVRFTVPVLTLKW